MAPPLPSAASGSCPARYSADNVRRRRRLVVRIGGGARNHRRLTRRGAGREHAFASAGVRREHAVAENEVDPRPRGQRRTLLEQRERLEDETLPTPEVR